MMMKMNMSVTMTMNKEEYFDIKYHLEQITMQVSSCEQQINRSNLDWRMLDGYIGELDYQLNQLKEIAEDCKDVV